MPRFSVITPVYNSRSFLSRCISSVQKQRMKDWELVIVNDGSTDGSDEELKKIVAVDARIRVFHQKNRGQFAARQLGICYATGEYILFLDSDDELSENCLSEIDETLQRTNADILFFMCRVIENGVKTQRLIGSCGSDEHVLPLKNLQRRVLFSNDLNSLCTKAFRRCLFDGNDTAYNNRVIDCVGEDKIQLLYPLLSAQKLVFTPQVWYYYHYRSSSTMHRYDVNKIPRMIAEDMFAVIREYMKYTGLSEQQDTEALDVYYLRNCLSAYFSTRKSCHMLSEYFKFRHYPWKLNLQLSILHYLCSSKLSMKEKTKIVITKLRL